jgi:hypothetical protein
MRVSLQKSLYTGGVTMVKQYQPFIVQYKNKQYLTMSIKCQSTMKHFKSIHHIHIYLPENDYHFNVCVHSLPKKSGTKCRLYTIYSLMSIIDQIQ